MKLTKQDVEVLNLLNRCRYATTRHLVELYFRDNKPKTATRRANLLTKKLNNLGLIAHLNRRIGGVRAGGAVPMSGTSPIGDKGASKGGRER